MVRLLTTFLIATALAVSLIAGTLAVFQDTENSGGNSISAATLDLLARAIDLEESVSGDPSGEDDVLSSNGVFDTWVITDITPGANAFCTSGSSECVGGDKVFGKVRFGQTSLSGNHLEARASLSLDENPVVTDTEPSSLASEMAKKLRLITLSYGTNNCLSSGDDFPLETCFLSDHDTDGVLTLNDLTFLNALDNMKPVPPDSGDIPLFMVLQWSEDSTMSGLGYSAHCGTNVRLCDNAFQGDKLSFSIEFTLNQSASQ